MNTVGSRYDRQIRLWGEGGQNSIERASVCVLGSSALATEILKNLILPGIGRFCIVDDALVQETDLGHNFFIKRKDVGKLRAAVTADYLSELNPAVKSEYRNHNPRNLDVSFLRELIGYTIVISTNLDERIAATLNDHIVNNGVYFIYTRICGMFGYLRLCLRQHAIWNIHEEHPVHDFRLDKPLEELQEMANSENLADMDHERHSHTPYLLLYLKALEEWRSEQDDESLEQDALPNTFAKRREFLRILFSMRKANENGSLDEENFNEAKRNLLKSFHQKKVPDEVFDIFNDIKTSSIEDISSFLNNTAPLNTAAEWNVFLQPFWIFATALHQFIDHHNGSLPLSGKLPDMTSDSARYVKIQQIYRDKARVHAEEVFRIANDVLEERRNLFANLLNDSITAEELLWSDCKEFCKNASEIAVQNGTSLSEEHACGVEKLLDAISSQANSDDDSEEDVPFKVNPLIWILLMKAMDRFWYEKDRLPGTNGVPCTIDSRDLKRRLFELIEETNNEDYVRNVNTLIPDAAIDEVCRYGAAELHVIAAILGGVVAQETIKLITHQYLPLNNTLIYDGHSQNAAVIAL